MAAESNALGVLPGDGWVVERTFEDGTRSVLPLAGWLVQHDGELRALPLSLGDGWTVRPRLESDQSAISVTAGRLRPQQAQSSYPDWRYP